MKYRYLCAAAAVLGWHAPLIAQETNEAKASSEVSSASPANPDVILVSAARSDGLALTSQYNGSASILTPQQIEQRQVRDIADVLRDVPGVAVSSVAGQTQIRLRGSEANHVLVLVDGIEVSDPFAGEFDIGTLQAEIGSRVEVLRGPQSALYGSDAIGGVVAYESSTQGGYAARELRVVRTTQSMAQCAPVGSAMRRHCRSMRRLSAAMVNPMREMASVTSAATATRFRVRDRSNLRPISSCVPPGGTF